MSSIDKAFGKAIRQYRNRLNLSQEDLAFRAGVHRTYISQLERGIKSPSLRIVQVVAKALELSMSDLIATAEAFLTGEAAGE